MLKRVLELIADCFNRRHVRHKTRENISKMNFDISVRPKEQPLVESIAVDVPPPSLSDNTADLDRLSRTLGQAG